MTQLSKFAIAKIAWVAASVLVLLWALWKLGVGGQSSTLEYETGLASLILMSVLSFPLGPVALFILHKLVEAVDISLYGLGDTIVEVLFVWIASVAGGYLQWFVLLPRAYQWLKRKLRSG